MLIQLLSRVIGLVCFVIGMLLNSLLVVLLCKNDSALCDKSYRPIILQICIMDMLSLILLTFYMPAYVSAGNYVIYYTLGFFNDVFENAALFTQIIFTAWLFSTLLFIISPSVQFLYRYLILCRKWKPSYQFYVGLYLLMVLFLLSFSILTNNRAVYVSRASNALYRDSIFTDNPANVDLLVITRDSSNPWSMIVTDIIEVVAFCVVVVCGIKIWLHFRRSFKAASDSGKNNHRLQRQVNYVLFIQGGMPMVGNLVSIFLALFLNPETDYMSFLLNFLALVIVIVNPLLTLLLVDSYRRAALDLCKCKSANASTSVVRAISANQVSNL
ncbi:serpentine type 7TM GPCR chemoreceptor str domain-containing protein [Ditylenchus destructor]|uniref:Serpentine type 7TM GPCR chemoreceptor str domain-containing protein n=1 Tax=Ditylenchus destructor TaxID=166010 RepID=A0AAD4MLC4_9BILA|nr:serpentine type 7TM GPCR chemoreceptor str domain-containing protein [Ditylenchus destructor]